MNGALFVAIADTIMEHPDHFTMDTWFDAPNVEPSMVLDAVAGFQCGTAACIAGWAVALAQPNRDHHYNVSFHAQMLLDVDGDTASSLFYGSTFWRKMHGVDLGKAYFTWSPEVVAATLRYIAVKGKLPKSPRAVRRANRSGRFMAKVHGLRAM